ncbi:MAG TPA: TetR family transcriptional regulator C-terminal domain-containing protein [Rhodoglobus sp.]|nr:TetR family transcriptional regulator C-terminal domain-containing protein [Rhodoglobus sp.]HPG76395.1 TetR family transcriptional regulator C-terminal domain-containing protein [Rhodoglobus sp.]HPM50800.1 TetR family transcriptional regulator C-terminal domain-containing protein [Rhodoglobus sp.]
MPTAQLHDTMDDVATLEDGRRVRGDVSRRAVMERAVNLASVEGLDGLSIGALAAESAMSKGGIVALFGTKEQLQLATVEAARQLFTETVITPALAAPAGLTRLRTLVEAWLDYSERRVFQGGCFFAAATAEMGTKPGPVRDAVAAAMDDWRDFVAGAVQRAIDAGDLSATVDPDQLAFEIIALLDGANAASVLRDTVEPYSRARSAISRLLP